MQCTSHQRMRGRRISYAEVEVGKDGKVHTRTVTIVPRQPSRTTARRRAIAESLGY